MNDDPTQLFPETHWKRYATEPVSVPRRDLACIIPNRASAAELGVPALPANDVRTLMKLPARPLLS